MSSRLSGTELFVPDMLNGQKKTCRGERRAKNVPLEAMRQKTQSGYAVNMLNGSINIDGIYKKNSQTFLFKVLLFVKL